MTRSRTLKSTSVSILLHCLKDIIGTVIDTIFELLDILPSLFLETRDSTEAASADCCMTSLRG